MKLADVLLLGLTIMFLIIGIDQTLILGFNHAYWAFMLALVAFFTLTYRKSRRNAGAEPENLPKKRKRAK